MDADLPTPARSFSEAFDIGRGLRHGFAAVRRCFPILWVGGCIRACTSGGTGGGGGGGGGKDEREGAMLDGLGSAFASLDPREWFGAAHLPTAASLGGAEAVLIVAILAVVVIAVAIGFAIYSWFTPGWLKLQEEIARTGEGQWGTLFGTTEPFARMYRWTLLKTAIVLGLVVVIAGPLGAAFIVGGENPDVTWLGASLGWLAVGLLPAVWVGLALNWGDLVVTFEGAGAMEALDRGLELARGNRVGMFVFLLLVGLVSMLFALVGFCALLIGALFTIPLSRALGDFAFVESYLLYTRPKEETDGWSIWTWAA